MSPRAGFGEDPGLRGLDLTQGYRDRNPYLDKGFVQRQIEPYKGAGLPQELTNFRGKSDSQLYDMAANAVIKMAGIKTPPPATDPPPATPPAPPSPPAPPPSGNNGGNGNGGNGGNNAPPVPIPNQVPPDDPGRGTSGGKKKNRRKNKKKGGASAPIITVPTRNVPRDTY